VLIGKILDFLEIFVLLKHSKFDLEHSMVNVRGWILNDRSWTLNVQSWIPNVRCRFEGLFFFLKAPHFFGCTHELMNRDLPPLSLIFTLLR
jgi:hypothetical protein